MAASRRKSIGWLLSGMAVIFLLAATTVQAGSVKDRMAARAPEILKLKAQGLIGENNQGYLELRGSGGGSAAGLIQAENEDRVMVYQAIASKTGATAEQVGQRAAAKRAQVAGNGEWVQKPGGAWYQK